jgi:two-component system chemotaxis response regulator CheB
MTSTPVKILIVDDTVTYRSILSRVVEGIPGVEVMGTAVNGKIALAKLCQNPADLVLLDIEMPEMDGLEVLKVIRSQYPKIDVVMISGMSKSSANITIRALEAGAIDFIPKPEGHNLHDSEQVLKQKLLPIIKLWMTRKELNKTTPQSTPNLHPTPQAIANSGLFPQPKIFPKLGVVAIGVSTGGPVALQEVIPKLPADLGVPVLIVQHMPPLFTSSLAESLTKKSKLPVKEAEDGELVKPNIVYIAPGGRHMLVRQSGNAIRIVLNDQPPENSCRPSVDVLFRSVASVYQSNMLAVIMTGMGSDGLQGVRAMKRSGTCFCLSQNEQSCVVYGMPRAVDEAGLSDERTELSNLAERIMSLVKYKQNGCLS